VACTNAGTAEGLTVGRLAPDPDLGWQPSLFATGDVSFDRTFQRLTRKELPPDAWVDHQPGWVIGADELFAQVMELTPWRQRTMWMYDHRVPEPRLTHRWLLDDDAPPLSVLVDMARALSEHYGVRFTQVGTNLYRDGNDSVAWHGDRVARELQSATVALISLGEPRPFKLRPKGGGRSISYLPDRGDLLVMGGSCQRTWDHAVPKVRRAGPRMSIQFRHAYDTS
jgi:alkylated DNA repair dioxygenase AlkB